MLRIDLLPPEFRKKEKPKVALPPFATPKAMLILLVILVVFQISLNAYERIHVSPKYDALLADFTARGPQLRAVRMVKKKTARIQKVNRQLTVWMQRPIVWTNILNSMTQATVKGLWLEHVQIATRELLITDPTRIKKDRRGNIKQKEKRVILIVKGKLSAHGDQAAIVSRFVQKLKAEPTFDAIMEDVFMHNVANSHVEDADLYEFTIYMLLKHDLQKHFEDVL